MTDDDLKAIVAKYQQKAFELFNSNIVLETQIEKLNTSILSLTKEIEDLKKTKRNTKSTGDFD
jgi:2C-methyl-D-erythritol 2,4-cyclodiphosphate synthase